LNLYGGMASKDLITTPMKKLNAIIKQHLKIEEEVR